MSVVDIKNFKDKRKRTTLVHTDQVPFFVRVKSAAQLHTAAETQVSKKKTVAEKLGSKACPS